MLAASLEDPGHLCMDVFTLSYTFFIGAQQLFGDTNKVVRLIGQDHAFHKLVSKVNRTHNKCGQSSSRAALLGTDECGFAGSSRSDAGTSRVHLDRRASEAIRCAPKCQEPPLATDAEEDMDVPALVLLQTNSGGMHTVDICI